jgi:hypothetical protein
MCGGGWTGDLGGEERRQRHCERLAGPYGERVRLAGYKRWQPRRSGDEPARRIASDTVRLQAEKSIASTFRTTGSSKAESQLHAKPNSEHRRTKKCVESTGDEKMYIRSVAENRAAGPFPRREWSVSLKMKLEIRTDRHW